MLTPLMGVTIVVLGTFIAVVGIRLASICRILGRHEKMLMSHGIAILQNKTKSKWDITF